MINLGANFRGNAKLGQRMIWIFTF